MNIPRSFARRSFCFPAVVARGGTRREREISVRKNSRVPRVSPAPTPGLMIPGIEFQAGLPSSPSLWETLLAATDGRGEGGEVGAGSEESRVCGICDDNDER